MAKDEKRLTILERREITPEELTDLVDHNPSLRGIVLGYVAELHLIKRLLSASDDIKDSGKKDNHNRAYKGDRLIVFRGHSIKVESKSLQTNSIRQETAPDTGKKYWVGKCQVDASDRRKVTFPDASKLETTCLRRGEFDLLAVNCFEFEKTRQATSGRRAHQRWRVEMCPLRTDFSPL
jgi:hypothetical protein